METRTRDVVESLLEGLWSTKAAAPNLGRSTFVTFPHEPKPLREAAAVMDAAQRMQSGFPDYRAVVDDAVVEGDTVVVRLTAHGTHRGDFLGIPPTGRHFSLQQVALARVTQGTVSEFRLEFDLLGWLGQLGVIPPMETIPRPALWVMSRVSRLRRMLGRRGCTIVDPAPPGATANLDGNKAIVHAVLERAFNGGDLSVVDELFAPDVDVHHPVDPAAIRGTEAFKDLPARLLQGFPDLRVTLARVVAEGDKVGARWIIHGTHTGTYRGVPPTGNPVTIPVNEILHVRDGRIVEAWFGINLLGVAQQLGVLPSLRVIARVQRVRTGLRRSG